jgi:DNA-directed RNA polymerase
MNLNPMGRKGIVYNTYASIKLEPAFKHSQVNDLGFHNISYHPALYELLLTQPVHSLPWMLPMIVSPRPWVTWNSGGTPFSL